MRTTEAAKDVIEFIDMVKEETSQQTVYIYGVSYGTYLLNRVLQLSPDIADLAVLSFYSYLQLTFYR